VILAANLIEKKILCNPFRKSCAEIELSPFRHEPKSARLTRGFSKIFFFKTKS
jgi:hypothetical protein